MTALTGVLAAAAVGPVLEAVLVPLSGQGKLRVTYNWLYSALNCDPADSSDFVWVLSKISPTQVSLSPRDPFEGRHLYASVRDDLGYYVQVQAPGSAHWITQVGRDEVLSAQGDDLLTVSFLGFNNQYLSVETELSRHGGHDGYRVRSVGSGGYAARTFFVGLLRSVQDVVTTPQRAELTRAVVGSALVASGQPADPARVDQLLTALN